MHRATSLLWKYANLPNEQLIISATCIINSQSPSSLFTPLLSLLCCLLVVRLFYLCRYLQANATQTWLLALQRVKQYLYHWVAVATRWFPDHWPDALFQVNKPSVKCYQSKFASSLIWVTISSLVCYHFTNMHLKTLSIWTKVGFF